MTRTDTDRDDPRSRHSMPAKQIGIGLIVAIALGGLLFGAGWWFGRRPLLGQLQQAQTELAQTESSLIDSENRRLMLRSLVSLYQSAIALDQRNFGTANNFLNQAETTLLAVEQPPASVDENRLTTLQQQIANTNIDVAQDLEAQRAEVLRFANQLNVLIPEPPPAELTTSPVPVQ